MEYLPAGDLERYIIRPFSERETQIITLQLLEGMDFMHSNGFAHRDLKPKVPNKFHTSQSIQYITITFEANPTFQEYFCTVSRARLVGQNWRLWYQETSARGTDWSTILQLHPSLYRTRSLSKYMGVKRRKS